MDALQRALPHVHVVVSWLSTGMFGCFPLVIEHSGFGRHASRLIVMKFPESMSQVVQSKARAVSLLYLPVVQLLQSDSAVLSAASLYLPSGQSVQSSCSV